MQTLFKSQNEPPFMLGIGEDRTLTTDWINHEDGLQYLFGNDLEKLTKDRKNNTYIQTFLA